MSHYFGFAHWGAVAVLVAVVNAINVITMQHEEPAYGSGPIVWEATSWVTVVLFFWIPWIAYRLSPPAVRVFAGHEGRECAVRPQGRCRL